MSGWRQGVTQSIRLCDTLSFVLVVVVARASKPIMQLFSLHAKGVKRCGAMIGSIFACSAPSASLWQGRETLETPCHPHRSLSRYLDQR